MHATKHARDYDYTSGLKVVHSDTCVSEKCRPKQHHSLIVLFSTAGRAKQLGQAIESRIEINFTEAKGFH
jgi:hypothetical protein